MRNILTMAIKDLKILSRDAFGMFWLLVFPLLFALFFGSIFAGEGETAAMRIAVIDRDGSEASESFVEALSESESLELAELSSGEPWTAEAARERVRRGDIVAAVLVPEGYGDTSSFMFAGDPPTIEVAIDPSRRAEAGFLEGLITQASFARLQDMIAQPSTMTDAVDQALRDVSSDEDANPAQKMVLRSFLGSLRSFTQEFEPEQYGAGGEGDGGGGPGGAPVFEPIDIQMIEITDSEAGGVDPNSYEISFPAAMLWGVIGCAAGFAIGLVKERKDGTMQRLVVAPHTRGHILAGKGLACFLACCVVIVLMLLFGNLIFGVRVLDPVHLLMAIVSVGLCFVGMMLFVSTLGSTEEGVAGAGWAIFLVSAMLGGGMVPLIAMPEWMLSASNASPVKWAIVALEGAIWRDYSTREMLLPCAVLLGIGAVSFALGLTMLRRRM